MANSSIQQLVQSLRSFRVYHRTVGLALVLFVVISAVTGLLLAWKKEVAWIQPPTQKSEHHQAMNWLPIDSLAILGAAALAKMEPEASTEISRLDVRPSKGIVKVIFKEDWWEVQLDGQTGSTLSIARRHSDWIEQLHDGSLLADWFKLLSMSILGLGLLVLSASGYWLWHGPRKIRSLKKN